MTVALPTYCAACGAEYVHVGHPLKPGVTMALTCKCRFEIEQTESGWITIQRPPEKKSDGTW